MSPEADVLEMQSLMERIADFLAPRATDQARATAIHRAFLTPDRKPLFTWNRAYELLKAKARMVHGFEKDNAKQRLAKLEGERADAVRESQANYRTLEARIAQLEALYERIDPEHVGEQVAAFRAQARGQGQGIA
jgi:hypothetical protein